MKKNLKMNFDFDLKGLGQWTDETGEMISNIVAGGELFQDWNFIEGNTYKKAINIVDTDAAFQIGSCVTGVTGSIALTQRDIDVQLITDRQELCIDDLKSFYTAMKYQGKGAMYDELEFETAIMEDKSKKVIKEIERQSLVGDENNTGEVNGLLVIADGETADLNHYATFAGMTAGNAVSSVDDLITEHIDGNANIASAPSIMYMSYSDAFKLTSALISEYGDFLDREKDFRGGEMIKFQYPKFPNVTIVGTHALNGNGSLFLTNTANLFHSGDLVNDSDMIYTEANKYHQKYLMLIKFFLGFNYAFPENVSYLKKV